MAYRRKTWREKLADDKGLPKVIPIEGNSYRLREHAALVPESMRTRSSLLDPQGQQPSKRRPGRPPKEPRDHASG